MLGHLVEHAKLRVTIAATHYGGQAVVAACFSIAAGFGVAAVFIMIAQAAGALVACITMAVAFLLLAIVVGMIMASREGTQRLAMRQASHNSAMSAGMTAGLRVGRTPGVRRRAAGVEIRRARPAAGAGIRTSRTLRGLKGEGGRAWFVAVIGDRKARSRVP